MKTRGRDVLEIRWFLEQCGTIKLILIFFQVLGRLLICVR